MAGMCPGVGVPHRRKVNKQPRQDSQSSRHGDPLGERREPLVCNISALDETALRARQRLERKLGYLYPASSSSESQSNTSGGRNYKTPKKDIRSGKKLLGKPWSFQLKRWKSHRKVCSVCLEDFQGEQRVMDLSCSHKYHSECLLPWLADHPHCPYCRTPVQS